MDQAVLEVQKRDTSVKAQVVRRQNLIPAQYYGHGVENVNLQMDYQTFRKLFRDAGENTIIDLKIEGEGDKKVLVHKVDYHPVSGDFHHVEFINVRMDEKVTTHVPIHLEGEAPAVKTLAGVLVQNLSELEITCLPGDLIHEVIIGVESLVDFNASIHVSDLVVPKTVEIVTDMDTTVANVSPPREEEEEIPVEAPDVDGVMVDGETQEVPEGEGGDDKKVESKDGGDDKKEEGGE